MIKARELLQADSAKDHNRARVVRAVMVEPSSQNRLAQLTSLSEATVSAIVRGLVDERVLAVEPGPDRSKRVRLGEVWGAAVGIDLGYTHITVAVRHVGDPRLYLETAPIGIQSSAAEWLSAAVGLVHRLVGEAGMTVADIVSVGLAAPGGTDPRAGTVMQHVVPPLRNPGDPDPEEPVGALSARLGLNIAADNDANAGAYAEFLQGAGRDTETLVYVKASYGVGAGVIIDGSIIRGKDGFAGEIGHLTVDPDPYARPCRCGNRGCLEAYIGEPRLLDEVRSAYAGNTRWTPTSLGQLIERAGFGEPVDLEVLRGAGRRLGFALAQVGNILNPGRIVIGGRLSLARDPELLMRPLADSFRQYALRRVRDVPIVATELGEEAQIRGAIALGLRSHKLA